MDQSRPVCRLNLTPLVQVFPLKLARTAQQPIGSMLAVQTGTLIRRIENNSECLLYERRFISRMANYDFRTMK
jgi:hypothetical protein